MLNKIKYKLWKHLNKKMERIALTGKVTFLSRKKYELWKHLSEKLNYTNPVFENRLQKIMTIGIEGLLLQKLDEASEKKASVLQKTELPSNGNPKNDLPSPSSTPTAVAPAKPKEIISAYKQIIACQGCYFSGSSTLSGFFKEFDNTTIIGADDFFQKQHTDFQSEMVFFEHSGIFNFIDAFHSGSLLEKDFAIKRFISSIYRCFNQKGTAYWEHNPSFFTQEFFDNSMFFLTSVLDLDSYTISFMKNKTYPIIYQSNDTVFHNCSFLHHPGAGQYVLYHFKDINPDAFDEYARNYIRSLFRLQSSKEFYCFDQMLPGNLLDKLNVFMDKPIKQIVVRRDPRDQFLSAFRCDGGIMPRSVNGYVNFYHNRLNGYLNASNPNRLVVRFEDLVLKYDETTKKIMDFIGLDESHHINPKAVFDPVISVSNIGAYKYFEDQDFMRQIEERLGEFCFYPEKENLSEEAWGLLKKNDYD